HPCGRTCASRNGTAMRLTSLTLKDAHGLVAAAPRPKEAAGPGGAVVRQQESPTWMPKPRG
ncbi:MAG: hypothetical protein OWR62_12005, partial [Sulfobacillus thermotolerans]|nr:hypothetical protein [Sulfobacillus thermotolerans]